MDAKTHLHNLLGQTVDNICSVKFYIMTSACLFLYLGKLDSSNWVQVMLVVSGFRTLNQFTAIVKGLPQAGKVPMVANILNQVVKAAEKPADKESDS